MVALQIISKILATKDCSILEKNNLTKEYFVEYQDEIQFILDHVKQYGTVPDKATFLSHSSLPPVRYSFVSPIEAFRISSR